MKRIHLLWIFLAAFPVIAAAGMLDSPSGVRPLGMGGAFGGIADDISAVYYNPAGLGQFRSGEIYLLYNDLYGLGLMDSFVISVASPGIAEGTLAFSMRSSGVGNKVNFMGNYSESIYTLSYGVELVPLFYAGANLKYIKVNYDVHASAIGMDAAVLIRVFERHASAGLFVKNINSPSVRWENTTSEEMDPIIRLGFAFRPNNDMTFGLDLDRINEENYDIHAGGEIWLFRRMLAPRAGFAFLQNDGTVLSAGASFLYRAFRVDYTLENHYELGINHVFGVLVKF